MRLHIFLSVCFASGLHSAAAISSPDCQMTGTSSLWQDESGAWVGASRIEWKNCTDGKSYSAACLHRGSGESMESCSCSINDEWIYERSCEGATSPIDLVEASRLCCQYFEEIGKPGSDVGQL